MSASIAVNERDRVRRFACSANSVAIVASRGYGARCRSTSHDEATLGVGHQGQIADQRGRRGECTLEQRTR
jgi:hypothetical protein